MNKSACAIALLIISMPCLTDAKERGTRGTIVDIWQQIDLSEHHSYVYRVETETRFYELRGEYPKAFQLGDSFTFTLDKDRQHAEVIGARGKKTKLLLIKEELKAPPGQCRECQLSVRASVIAFRFSQGK